MTDADQDRGAEIALTGCAKTFPGGTRALTPIDLTVARGEILGLLGPSGCGKTTLLRIIAGLERPDTGGAVRFDGRDVTDLPIERRAVGMVFQSYALFPNMSVAGNVGYALRVRRRPQAEIRARVAEVLAFCRIEELADRPIHALSGGQRQRVALARAVAMRPRALLLDEPLSALDAALRDALRDELAELLRALSITAVFVTHDQSEAMAIADRVAVMRAGRILQAAPPREIYARPTNGFVASFVGGANRLEGDLRDGALGLPGGRLELPQGAPADAEIYIRPEAITLRAAEGAALRGRVARCVFLGDRTRVLVEGAATTVLAVETAGAFDAPPGAAVGLEIDPAALLITQGVGADPEGAGAMTSEET